MFFKQGEVKRLAPIAVVMQLEAFALAA